MSKYQDLQDSIKQFCESEYYDANAEFKLMPPDYGGYDCTGAVTMKIEGDEAVLTFHGDFDKYKPFKTAVYRFKLI